MSLRVLLATLLASSLALVFAFVYFSTGFLQDRILALLPPTLAASTAAAIHILVLDQFIGLFAFGAIISCIIFWILELQVARPLNKLQKSVSTFAVEGEHEALPELSNAPIEIRTLRRVFSEFTDKVEVSHQKDTDISRVKSDFISTAAHQLRTPLTGIRWALEALEKENLSEDQKALVKNATDKSHDLVAIVGTLLDISSIESGKYKYAFNDSELDEMLSQVATDFEPLAQKNNVSLFYAKSETPVPHVKIDKDRIKWVLNNLVENAIRYTPAQGSVQLSIEVTAGQVKVKVKDTGIGIKPEDRGNIFERFYRAGNAIAKENQGNGLGLYIARTIATDHGGDLDFVANEGTTGTTFILTLPIAA
jgi:signal transduction histidine kinase